MLSETKVITEEGVTGVGMDKFYNKSEGKKLSE